MSEKKFESTMIDVPAVASIDEQIKLAELAGEAA